MFSQALSVSPVLLSTCFLISFLSPDHFTSLPFYIFMSFAYLVEYLLNAGTQPSSFTSSINLFPLYRFPEKKEERIETSTYFQKPFKTTIYLFRSFFFLFFIICSLQESPEEIVHFELKQKNLAIRIRHFFFLFRFIIPKEPARKRATHR